MGELTDALYKVNQVDKAAVEAKLRDKQERLVDKPRYWRNKLIRRTVLDQETTTRDMQTVIDKYSRMVCPITSECPITEEFMCNWKTLQKPCPGVNPSPGQQEAPSMIGMMAGMLFGLWGRWGFLGVLQLRVQYRWTVW